MSKQTLKSLPLILEQFNAVHLNKYDYSKVVYLGSNKKVEIICPHHGPFWQWPNDHRYGRGCPKCAKNGTPTIDELIDKVNEYHGDIFVFDNLSFSSLRDKVTFQCLLHGERTSTVKSLWHGGGCRECGFERQLHTKLKNGTISDPATRDQFEQYRHEVRKLSDQNFIKYYYDINPTGIRRGKDFHLDHIISIMDGFINDVPVEEIADPANLRLIPSVENQKKGCKRDEEAISNFDPANIKTRPLTKDASEQKRIKSLNTYQITDLAENATAVITDINKWCADLNLSPSSAKWAANYQKSPFKGRYIITKV